MADVFYGTDANDQIDQGVSVLNSSSVVSALGNGGDDTIVFNAANVQASIFAAGGSGSDAINIANSGTTTIFGGNGTSDPTDAADVINFVGGGTVNIFANAGADTTTLNVDATGVANIFAGTGDDHVVASGSGASLFVAGGEGSDIIGVSNTGGATTIFGGISSSDAGDSGDAIHVVGAGNLGTWNIFANGGNDLVDATSVGAFGAGANVSIYAGIGQDTVAIGSNAATAGAKGSSIFVAGGEGSDNITVNSNGATTIWGGASQNDAADGADTIGIYGSGTSFVFGNGGNDVITVGVNLQDASTKATINGGAGNDTLVVSSVSVPGANVGSVTLTGGAGADVFVMPSSALSSVTVTDFSILDGDQIHLTGGGGVTGPILGVLGNFNSLQDALNAATNVTTLVTGSGGGTLGGLLGGVVGTVTGLVGNVLGVTGVVGASGGLLSDVGIGSPVAGALTAVVQGGDTYLVSNDGVQGFDPSLDKVIKLTGVTDLTGGLLSHVTLV